MFRVYTKIIFWFLLILTLLFFGSYFLNINWTSIKKHFWSFSSKAENVAGEASTERFEEGKHYKKLSAKITSSPVIKEFIANDGGKIQVIEFFGYACLWCQRIHPYLNAWTAKKPEDVIFYRIPVYFNKGWDVLAKAYYMVEKLGKTNTLDKEFFMAVHKDNLDLGKEKNLEEFFAKHGVNNQQFKELYHSFEINHAYGKGNEIANVYEIIVSPAVVVNTATGSYLITAAMAGTEQNFIDIIDFLIERDHKEMQTPKASQ